MSDQACIDAMKEAFHFLSESQLRDYAREVMSRAREYRDLGPQASIERAKSEMHDKLAQEYFDTAQQAMKNQKLFEQHSGELKSGKTVRDMLARNPSNKDFRSENIEMAQRAVTNFLGQKFFRSLSKEAVHFFENFDNELSIAQGWIDALEGRSSDIPKETKELGNAFKDYTDEVGYQMVDSGLLSLDDLNKNRFLKAIHNPARMMGSLIDKAKAAMKFKRIDVSAYRQRWANYIYDRLDLDKTFSGTKYENDEGAIRDFLSNTYDKIVQGQDTIRMRTGLLTDMKQIEKQRHMFFTFKNAKSFVEYNREYGHGTLIQALTADMHATGSKVGMARMFGTRPADMFDHLHKVQDGVKPESASWWHTTGNIFKQLTGESNTVVSPTLAQFFSNLRQWTSASSLVMLPIQSLTDINMGASWLSRFMGENIATSTLKYWGNVSKQFGGLLKQFTDEERKKIANSFRIHIDSHGGYMGKFAAAENMGRWTNYLSSKFYKYNGTVAWDRGNQSGVIAQTMHALGEQMHLPFDKLPPLFQKTMRQFNLTPAEWDAIREQSIKSGGGVVSIDDVLDVSDNAIKNLQSKLPGVELKDIRNNLYLKLFSFFDTGAQNAILRPGAYEKALMYQGTKPGTLTGELLRTVMQFKGFPITYLSRQLADGFKNADGVKAKAYWAAQQFAYTLPLSVASTYLWYVTHGVSMPDTTKMNSQDQLAFAMQIMAPSLGVLNSGFDSSNQGNNLVWSLASSPTTRLIGNALSAPLALAGGNPKAAQKNVSKALQSIIPSNNIPFASPYLKQILGEKVYLQPGQSQLYGGQ